MAMQLKLDDQGHVVVQDNKPVYVHDDGKEFGADVPTMYGQLLRDGRRNSELQKNYETLEATMKAFEGIEPESARKAIELTKNIDESKLLSAGKVEEIKAAARKAAEEQVAMANKANAEALKAAEADRDKLRGELYGEKIGGSFNRSKLITEKFAIPADMVQARFGQNFKVEDGKIVAYDVAGNKVFSHSKPGEIAEFDEALEILVSAYPYKDQILKGANSSGTGARPSNGGAANGVKTMRMSEFRALPPAQQATTMTGKDRPTLVDG